MKMTLESTSTYLRETWSASLKSGVRSALKEVERGWFNLDERSAEVDAVSKRRRHVTPSHVTPHLTSTPFPSSGVRRLEAARFLRMVNFMMEDGTTDATADGSARPASSSSPRSSLPPQPSCRWPRRRSSRTRRSSSTARRMT